MRWPRCRRGYRRSARSRLSRVGSPGRRWRGSRRRRTRTPPQPCRGQPLSRPATTPKISVLKPLHGDEPLLEEALASICRQDYPAWQVVFGVQDAADTALPVVRRLQARFPECDIAVVVDPTPHGPKPQGGQPDQHAAGGEARRAGDRRLRPARGTGLPAAARVALQQPGTGLVTTLYTGLPAAPSPLQHSAGRGGWRLARLGPCRSTTTSCQARCWHAPWAGRTASGRPWRCDARRWNGSAGCRPWWTTWPTTTC